MRLDRLDLNLLVALDALIEEKSVTAAADSQHLTQSAMSAALNRLREYFQDSLLVPSGRRMILTPKAEELAQPVRHVLTLIRSTIATPTQFEVSTSDRRFYIVVSDYVFAVLVADAMKNAMQEAPYISFDISAPAGLELERLDRGDVDLYITLIDYLSAKHPVEPLFEDELVCVFWNGNTLVGDVLDEDLFYKLGHVIVVFGSERFPAFAETVYENKGVAARKIEMRIPSYSGVPEAVIGTNRIATMNRLHAEYFARILPIRLMPVPMPMPIVREGMQWHTMRNQDKGLRWLMDHVKAQAAVVSAQIPAR